MSPSSVLLAYYSLKHVSTEAFVLRESGVSCLYGLKLRVTSVALSPDGQRLAYSSNEKEIPLWQVESSGADTMVDTLPIDVPSPTRRLSISPDSQYIARASDQGVDIWSVADKMVIRRLGNDAGDVTSVCFSADGRLLARAEIRALACSRDGRYILSSSETTNEITLWDVATKEKLQIIEAPGPTQLLRLSEDQRYVLTERGAFPISGASAPGQDGSSAPATVECPAFLAVRDNWIVTGARRRLWLPPEYRGVWALHGRVFDIGSKLGRVLKFVLRE
ncbi:WD40 repeat domain-containing protein [Aspergillus fijiensis CBS 313.89]|uniref:WD40 repeat-like protein n=1 Tax=Aspergillus fijiensis CBS 313.89 TaxID=1448319 RepID=A0A8G1RL74_9EURO|nr:WD40 repeat-like protein [Aspergillus fijiensis CBS 313.89]RAK72501.1 WD40 repeat-like protein [Aspergillus fijiensis CBS 313.89]